MRIGNHKLETAKHVCLFQYNRKREIVIKCIYVCVYLHIYTYLYTNLYTVLKFLYTTEIIQSLN